MSTQLFIALAESKLETIDSDVRWRAFVIDQLEYLKKESHSEFVPNTIINMCKYDCRRLMLHYDCPTQLEWIFMLMNNLVNELDIYIKNDTGNIYIFPEIFKINTLLSLFQNQFSVKDCINL